MHLAIHYEQEHAFRVSFVMPSSYTMDTLPVPKNADLELKEVPSHSVAALTFFGVSMTTHCHLLLHILTPLLSVPGCDTHPDAGTHLGSLWAGLLG